MMKLGVHEAGKYRILRLLGSESKMEHTQIIMTNKMYYTCNEK